MQRTTPLIASILTCVFAAGCLSSPGSNQWYEKANPQTRVSFDPFTKTVTLFDNNGRSVVLKDAELSLDDKGMKSFKIGSLEITERSVENRMADAEQSRVIGQLMPGVIAAVFDGIAKNIGAFQPYLPTLARMKQLDEQGRLSVLTDLAPHVPAILRAAGVAPAAAQPGGAAGSSPPADPQIPP